MFDRIGVFLHSLFGASIAVTWIETANHVLDLIAGIIAVFVGILSGLYWIRKLKKKDVHEAD